MAWLVSNENAHNEWTAGQLWPSSGPAREQWWCHRGSPTTRLQTDWIRDVTVPLGMAGSTRQERWFAFARLASTAPRPCPALRSSSAVRPDLLRQGGI